MKQLKGKSIGEVLALGFYKATKGENPKRHVSVYIPPRFIPPTPPYRSITVESKEYGRVRVFTRPSKDGGWIISLTFPPDVVGFNPVLSGEVAKTLREKLQK
jgi:hypothetical protein